MTMTHNDFTLPDSITDTIEGGPHQKILERVFKNSPFALRLVTKNPIWLNDLIQTIETPWDQDQFYALFASHTVSNIDQLKMALRLVKNQVYLRILARDVGQLACLTEVMSCMSLLADFSIQMAQDFIVAWQEPTYGKPSPSSTAHTPGLIVVGMGKLGGRELNVSSDIDIILTYSEDGTTTGTDKPLSHQEYFTLIAKQLIDVLHEPTQDGYVFRVDLRLRPFGESGPLVCSFDALERYYQSHGRDWERYALIKARVVYGDDQELLRILKPFVFRKYLDFNAIDSLRNLKTQISREVKKRGMHDNIKLGEGGIREIEFIAQVFQLIRGGRQHSLQTPSTLSALQEIESENLLPNKTCKELNAAYHFFRKVEHCLQYEQDNQTHTLPKEALSQQRLVNLLQLNDWNDLVEKLNYHRRRVQLHFEQLLQANKQDTSSPIIEAIWSESLPPVESIENMTTLGYKNAQAALERIMQIKHGRRYGQLPEASRTKFDVLTCYIIENSVTTVSADRALFRALDLLEKISGRTSYLSLFIEHPRALQQVLELMAISPFISQLLVQYPLLLDTLLDLRQLYSPLIATHLDQELKKRLQNIEQYDQELQMDLLREFKQFYNFKVAAQDVKGLLPLTEISDALSLLADVIIKFVLNLTWQQMKLEGEPNFIIIAYGKLGSKELSYSSDIDMVFLYDDKQDNAMQTYIRLGQRINHWLSTYTSAGILYQTDYRLRPDGSKGLLAIPIESFKSYQLKRAWVWEHQALTRARCIAGNTHLGEQFTQIRQTILCQQRDKNELKKELLSMRERISNAKSVNSKELNIKHIKGGIIDIEFIVQYLILAYAREFPLLLNNTGNIALLNTAAICGIIDHDLAHRTGEAYQSFRQFTHDKLLRDINEDKERDNKLIAMSKPVQQLWSALFEK